MGCATAPWRLSGTFQKPVSVSIFGRVVDDAQVPQESVAECTIERVVDGPVPRFPEQVQEEPIVKERGVPTKEKPTMSWREVHTKRSSACIFLRYSARMVSVASMRTENWRGDSAEDRTPWENTTKRCLVDDGNRASGGYA